MFMFKLVWMSFLGMLPFLNSSAVLPIENDTALSFWGTQLRWVAVFSF